MTKSNTILPNFYAPLYTFIYENYQIMKLQTIHINMVRMYVQGLKKMWMAKDVARIGNGKEMAKIRFDCRSIFLGLWIF